MIECLSFIINLDLEYNIVSCVKKNEIINVRVDSDVKAESKLVLVDHTLSHSVAFRMLLDYIISTGDIPDFMKSAMKK